MLNSDALTQLKQLKNDIVASKDIAEGNVRGTQNRFGFVDLDDGRQAFLAPEVMQQLLPGDRIKVELTQNDKKKFVAKLEKLLRSDFNDFFGKYEVKGNHHFVSADHEQMARWIFVPPNARKNYKAGDYVHCKITRHPMGHGKPQAKILRKIGNIADPGIERQYTIAKNGLRTRWSKEQLEQAKQISEISIDSLLESRTDLRDLPFVTIDAESTLDMDDALYAEQEIVEQSTSENQNADAQDGNWLVYIAIADPSAFVEAGSPLDHEAQARAASVYFPGYGLPMFPNELSRQVFSLLAGQDRPALVCKMRITSDGSIASFDFIQAVIRSHSKLSYQQVSEFLETGNLTFTEEKDSNNDALDTNRVESSLRCLSDISKARKSYRETNQLVQEENVDFFYKLDEQYHIESIEKRVTTPAHRLVEEAMLATNCCAAEILSQAKTNALFTVHAGFRDERLKDVTRLVQEALPDHDFGDLSQLDNFRELFSQLQRQSEQRVLLLVLRRLLQPGKMTLTPHPHFGLGLPCYVLITSPIRRYSDLHNHRIIKGLLSDNNAINAPENTVTTPENLPEQLQQQLSLNRQTIKNVEQWLVCLYLADSAKQNFSATISAVSNQGLRVKLTDTGIESFIQLRNTKTRPVRFDSQRMKLTMEGVTYELEQPVNVRLKNVNLHSKQLEFEILTEPNAN